MTSFFTALKADLTDRRLLPMVVVTLVALAAAIVYAVTGGSPSSTPSQAVAPLQAPTGISVSEAPQNTAAAVAETTNGERDQRKGSSRNPFALLPGAVGGESKAAEGSKAASGSSSSSASGTSGSSSASSGSSNEKASSPSSGAGEGSTPAQTKSSTPRKKSTTRKTYDVSVLFGVVPAGSAPGSAQLTPENHIKLLTPLPSSTQPLVVFRGVIQGGSDATFTLIGEAILHGSASCLPSETQCQELELQTGQSEQLEYLGPAGEPITYELRLLSISRTTASAAAARASKASLGLLRHARLQAAGLRPTSTPGVLAFSSAATAARVQLTAEPVAPPR
jgi:hypothetical protein